MKVDGVILSAGAGKRMKPLSLIISKPMLPICNRPILATLANSMAEAGFSSVILVVSPTNKETIKQYFESHPLPNDVPVKYVVQEVAEGTGHALLLTKPAVTGDTVFAMAGDNYLTTDFFKRIVEDHAKHRPIVTIALKTVPLDVIGSLSTVHRTEDGFITDIIEKPAPEEVISPQAATAAYVFDKELYNELSTIPKSKRGEYEVPTAFEQLMKAKKPIRGFEAEEWDHVSNPSDLWRLNMLNVKKENCIDESVIIGKNCVITNTVIGEKCNIGNETKLINCLILPNVIIPDNSTFEYSVLAVSPNGELETLQMKKDMMNASPYDNK